MNTRPNSIRRGIPVPPLFLLTLATLLLVPSTLSAQAKKKNPAGKVFIASVDGDAQIRIGDKIEPLTAKSVYDAEGVVIETAEGAEVTLVFSNGTSLSLGSDTRIAVKRFTQEPFTPRSTDVEIEPSISHLNVALVRGVVSVSSSRLIAGSSLIFQTPDATLRTLGSNLVIQAIEGPTKISVLAGDCTVSAGSLGLGGETLKAGQQAIVQPSPASGAKPVEIAVIPPTQLTQLDDQVATASMAKKTVYFEVREIKVDINNKAGIATSANATAAGSTNEESAGASGGGTGFARVNAFDGGSNTATSGGGAVIREIVPVEILPTTLPVEFTVSTARIGR